MKNFSVTVVICLICCLASGQTLVAKKIPSVWVWQVQGAGRSVYLLGEMHYFETENPSDVDFQLGDKVYSVSEKIWTEALTATANEPGNKSNSSRLKATTWGLLEKKIFSTTELLMSKNSNAEKKIFYEKAIAELDSLNAPRLLATIDLYANVNTTIKVQKPNAKLQPGFTNKIILQEKNTTLKKAQSLEPVGMIEKMWAANCDSDEILENAVSKKIERFDFNLLNQINSIAEIQKTFANPQTDISVLHKVISKSPDWSLSEMCDIAPRNLFWLPQLKKALDSSGAPIAFIVGIGHIGGENGLLLLLEKNGYKNIKRIYSPSEL